MLLEDVSHQTISITREDRPKKAFVDNGTTTHAVDVADQATDPIQGTPKEVQTVFDDDKISVENVRISEEVVQRVLDALHESQKYAKLFARLDSLHEVNSIRVVPIRAIPIQPPPELSIVGVVGGPSDRSIILIGEPVHESWCAHTCSVRIVHRRTMSSVLLPTCPVSASWLSRDMVGVGTVGGDIHLISGDILVSTTKMHSSSITSTFSPSPNRLVSSCMEGKIVISHVRGVDLVPIQEVNVRVSDLPRNIRNNRGASTTVGVVSVDGNNDEMLISSETGGLWRCSFSNLLLHPIPSQPQSIVSILSIPPFIVIRSEDGTVSIHSNTGELLDTIDISTVHDMCATRDGVLLCSTSSSLCFYDVSRRRVLSTLEVDSPQAMSLSPLQQLILVNSKDELVYSSLV